MGKRRKSTNGKLWANSARRRRALLHRLFERDKGRCRYCGAPVHLPLTNEENSPVLNPYMATVEHWPEPRQVLAIDLWWDEAWTILACNKCNNLCSRGIRMIPRDTASPQGILAQKLGRAIEERDRGH